MFITLILFCYSLNFARANYTVHFQESSIVAGVAINELLPNPEGSDTGKEWIELYNYSEAVINLNGWILTDTSSKEFVIENIDLTSKEFLVIYPNFSLNQSNEEVFLFDENRNQIDSFYYENSSEALSWARKPDGIGEWISDSVPTEGTSNIPEAVEYPDTILITEIYPTPEENEIEWLELFNNSEEEIELDSWKISDLSNSVVLKNLILSPYEYLELSEELSGITLNNSGDTISLVDPNGELVHEFAYEKTSAGISNITYEDSVVQTKVPTPGLENTYVEISNCFYDAIDINIQQFKSTDSSSDTNYKLTGSLTALPGQIYTDKIYVQDQSGGLMVRLPDEFSSDLNIGENIQVCGYHNEYYQEDEFVISNTRSIIILDSTSPVNPIPVESVNESLVGSLARIEGTISENSSTAITVQTQSEEIKVKLSHLSLEQEKSKGDQVEILGILTRYGDNKDGSPYYRLVPRTIEDVDITHLEDMKVATIKSKTSKATSKSSSSNKSEVKSTTSSKNTMEITLTPPAFQEKSEGYLELGIKRESQKKDQTNYRVAAASGFLISSSSLFILLDPERKYNPEE